ncbi:MAG: DUF4040 domain-containing protein [Clostridia bacterium]|nr:DUF4040 domain-containing protein [Clostridia bacterium]
MYETIIAITIVLLMMGTAVTALYARDLFISIILFGGFSFFAVLLYLSLRSPDVAFTEAVIGIVSTTFMISALKKTGRGCSR